MPWFEDVVLGETLELGRHTFTEDAILDFARRFDPQAFHLDREAARRSLFGDLCASGWHTAAIWMRLFVEHHRREAGMANGPAFGPSPGFQDLKWLAPVFVGDTICYTTRPTEKRPLHSRPQWGLITSRNEGWNQNGVLAFSFVGHVLLRRRGA